MPTIVLEQIIALLTGWKNSFFSWANEIGDKIASIKTNTDSLPDIESNTDDIKDNTAAVITPISNINSNVTTISSDVSTIKTDTGIIKNNASAIATSSGAAAAFAEDVANNTLEVKNKITTIASDTTQMRADSGSIRSDVSEIKNTLGFYLYFTLITENAVGRVANLDTDLSDYLQKSIVTIPADANGVSGLIINKFGKNLASTLNRNGYVDNRLLFAAGNYYNNTNYFVTEYVACPDKLCMSADSTDLHAGICFYDQDLTYISGVEYNGRTEANIAIPAGAKFFRASVKKNTNFQLEVNDHATEYEEFKSDSYNVSFTAPITDGAEVDLLSGIVKINTSPITYDSITPLAIRTFKGVNNIYSDIGDMSVTYRETLKHYLEKQQ